MPRRLVHFFAAGGAMLVFASAGLAAASTVTERVRVGIPGLSLREEFSQSLFLTIVSPPDYQRLIEGTWTGPPAVNNQGVGDAVSISWDFALTDQADLRAAARARMIQRYPLVQGARILVPHVVAGRRVGTIAGEFLLSQREARVEAALAFPLSRGIVAVVSFDALSPAFDDATPFGQYTVKGKLASTWNREQVRAAIPGVGLDGSLPPARVTANPTAGGRLVLGNVLDAFGHPVAGAKVRLVRRAKTVATGRADAAGRYSLQVRGERGTYRVVASLPRASSSRPPLAAVSRPFRAGR